jgi:protein-S-isoprenylcysteine O-methyltransferase Ste14
VAPLLYTHSDARIPFDVVLGTFALLELRVRVRSGRIPGGSRLDRGSLRFLHVCVVVGVLAGFVLAGRVHGAAIREGRWPIFVVGLILMVVGIALRQWAVAVLGRFFTVDVRVHPGQAVVEDGPYRWVRHPAYTGLVVLFVGIGLALGNSAALAVLIVVPTVGLVVRIRVEERALLDGLGEPYRRFAATRPRLFPGVW